MQTSLFAKSARSNTNLISPCFYSHFQFKTQKCFQQIFASFSIVHSSIIKTNQVFYTFKPKNFQILSHPVFNPRPTRDNVTTLLTTCQENFCIKTLSNSLRTFSSFPFSTCGFFYIQQVDLEVEFKNVSN